MRLREALDFCSPERAGQWVTMPGERPATSMLAGVFDPEGEGGSTQPLSGHTIAVFEPDPRLLIFWPVPEDSDRGSRWLKGDEMPEWARVGSGRWKAANPGVAVVVLSGAPIWQQRVWYLDRGSGVGGYVPEFEPVFGEREPDAEPSQRGWRTSSWAAGLAALINSFEPTGEFAKLDPTDRIALELEETHPVDAERHTFS